MKGTYFYIPASDITAAELSEVLELFFAGMGVAVRIVPPQAIDLIWNGLSAGAKRHFILEEKSPIVMAKH